MREKIQISMLGLLCLASLLVGCGDQKTDVVVYEQITPKESEPLIIRPETTEEEAREVDTETEATTQEEEIIAFADLKSVQYEMTEATYEEGVIRITYPQITQMENIQLQEQINQQIEQIAKAMEQTEGLSAYEINYEIATKGSGVLSFVLKGYRNTTTQAYPVQFVKTCNIDMSTGENLRLKDYADVAGVVSGLEQKYGYDVVSEGVDADDFDAFLNNGYMTDYAITLLDYDMDFQNKALIPAGYSCIRDNHVVLFIEAEHAMGDYVEIQFTDTITK